MSPALDGWIGAAVAIAVTLVQWRAGARRAEAVTRACHELRGPLTAARLGLELGGRTGGLSRERMRAIDLELGRAALALEDLGHEHVVSTLWLRPTLWRPRLEAVPPPKLVDLPALVSDSAGAWSASAEAAGVELRAQWEGAGATVEGDRFRIAQATGNLIANAIEHGGGRVEVRGRCTEAGARIEVVDGGPGLPAPVVELARRARRGRGERGRGLAIALDVAQAHGGRLAAAPSERGARLVLELPMAASPALAPEPGDPRPAPSPPSAPDRGRDKGA